MVISKNLWSALLASLAISSAAGATTAPAAGKTIKIAVAGPHTGANASFGEQEWKGASKAVDEINKAGGINGSKVELVKADDACEPKQAVAVANRLVDKDKVIAVVGHFCSAATIPASEIYNDANVLMMTPASTNPQVTDRGLPTVMRMCGRDDQQGSVAGNFIADKLKAKKVVVIHDKTTYGMGLADATRITLNKKGIKEVMYEGITQGEKDYNSVVTKLKSLSADAVFFGGLHPEAGLLVRQMRDQGVKAAFISGDGIVSNDFVTSAGGKKYAEGVYVTFGSDPRNVPSSKTIVDAFKKEGYNPEGYTLYAYASIQSIAAAAKATGSTDGKKMADWLRANEVQTIMGPKSWDKKGDLKVTDYVMYQWDNNGNYKELK